MQRRDALRWSAAGFCGAILGPSFWRTASAAPAVANGLRLPAGFRSRIIATTGRVVGSTSQTWHLAPDGGACFPVSDGGWIYTSNSEIPLVGGAAMIRFDSSARMYAARVSWDDSARHFGTVSWREVPDDVSARVWPMSTYTTGFNGGEGCWYDDGLIYFATKGDNRIWVYDGGSNRLEVIYDAVLNASSPLRDVDNIVVSRSGDLFVAEDGGDMQLCIITPERVVAPFLELEGHDGSEISGPAFNPGGSRLYFSSQRGVGNGGVGMTFEVEGPFRT